MQSALDQTDLGELMDMADLAQRDFAGTKGEVLVVSGPGLVAQKDTEREAAARREAEARHAHALKVPRRPAWTPDMTPEQLDDQERDAFLQWRRALAAAEEEESLVLTPFEKNLEVWRQLWRVLERSDIIVQVLDARDPLRYRCEDLEAFAREIAPSKRTVLLLNKADLLPKEAREAWAAYFDGLGVEYVLWSAHLAAKEAEMQAQLCRQADLGADVDVEASMAVWRQQQHAGSGRARVVFRDELVGVMEAKAREAASEVGGGDAGGPVTVGMVGYPNVGKSSTINAVFGGKRVAVAATPGKTKHFQTLHVHDSLVLCDCPGLVFPSFASSKPEMVAAGVIPIDRLTDIRQPVDVVARRVARPYWSLCYGRINIPRPGPLEDPKRPPTAAEVLRGLCTLRGWVNGSGLPDETRGGRQILKDYVDGHLLSFEYPPGHDGPRHALPAEFDLRADARASQASAALADGADSLAAGSVAAEGPGGVPAPAPLDEEAAAAELARDMEMMGIGQGKAKARRPDYKFQKKEKKGKGQRGKGAYGINMDGTGDGMGVLRGKRGGILPAHLSGS
ncbi:unnamed protein product [Pedinophyceae sp. YPF-701]|nr:unnamed protein product [Pedinophyceae sp. YPF-701]